MEGAIGTIFPAGADEEFAGSDGGMASHLAAQEPPEEEAGRDVRESGHVDDDMKRRVLELLRRCEKWKKFKGFRKYYLTSVPTEDDAVVVHPLEKSTTAEQWKHVITYNRTCSQRSCEILYTLLRSEYFPPEHNNGRYMILHVWRGEQHPDAVWPSSFTKRARRRRNKKYREEFHARSSSPPVQLQAYCVGEGNDQVSVLFNCSCRARGVAPHLCSLISPVVGFGEADCSDRQGDGNLSSRALGRSQQA